MLSKSVAESPKCKRSVTMQCHPRTLGIPLLSRYLVRAWWSFVRSPGLPMSMEIMILLAHYKVFHMTGLAECSCSEVEVSSH